MEVHSYRDLGLAVREKMDGGLSLSEAVDTVYRDVAENGVEKVWTAVGRRVVRDAERYAMQQGITVPSASKPKKKSWRSHLIENQDAVWDLEFYVPGAGRMRYGDLLNEHTYRIGRSYVRTGETYIGCGKWWLGVSEKQDDGETLEEAAKKGKFSATEMRFLEKRGKTDPNKDAA